ncbi:MAG: hypothetical protein H7138_24675, partial [Myxococcales bacterium]|nr:hypothetical protein [Myxococcales bacterium]
LVRVKEADAIASEKVGLVEARVRDAQLQVTDREGTVLAENVRRKALAEAAGREAEAIAIEKTGIATAVGVRERLLAEVMAKEAEAGAIEKRMLAEAKGLAEKAIAMRALEGEPRAHEEFRLRLEADRAIAIEQIKARILMSEQQAKVMAEAMGKADIKIVGGDGQFFDRFVKAVSLGSSIDGVFDNSNVVRNVVSDLLPSANPDASPGRSPGSTLAGLLGNLMIQADDSTRTKLKSLLEQARQLGVQDDKVS